MKKEKLYLTLRDLEDWDLPKVIDVLVENGWTTIWFIGGMRMKFK